MRIHIIWIIITLIHIVKREKRRDTLTVVYYITTIKIKNFEHHLLYANMCVQ